MQRGIIQLTKEEVIALNDAFHWGLNGGSILASKIQYSMENLRDNHDIEMSEEDLELLLDDIMPVDENNVPLKSAMDKVGELLRRFRYLNVPTTIQLDS